MSEAGPREQLNELLNLVMTLAQQHLAKYGEFYPFGASTGLDGESRLNAAYTGEEHPASMDLLELLRDVARKQTPERLATAICYDVKIRNADDTGDSDAIAVELEHRDGDSMTAFLPYTLSGAEPVFDDEGFFLEPRERTLWSS